MTDQGTIVILGATSAVAQSVAQSLAEEGREMILVARDAAKLAAVAADLTTRGGVVTEVVQDFVDVDSHPKLLSSIEQAEHFFLFFGTLTDQSAAEADWSVAKAGMMVNMEAPLSLLHGLANSLSNRGSGSLVVVSSVAGDRGRASNYWYGTAKGALSIHCQGLRNRLAKHGVPLLTVKPGFIDTPMTAHLEKKPAPLWASSEQVASGILKAWRKQKDVVYVPGFWRLIMLIIVSIPEFVFKRLSL